MKEQLISLDTAKLAKEKGFDARKLTIDNALYKDNVHYVTQSMLQTWLRKTYNIYVIPNLFSKAFVMKANEYSKENGGDMTYKMNFADVFKVEDNGEKFTSTRTIFGDSYEDAFELGLQFALSRI